MPIDLESNQLTSSSMLGTLTNNRFFKCSLWWSYMPLAAFYICRFLLSPRLPGQNKAFAKKSVQVFYWLYLNGSLYQPTWYVKVCILNQTMKTFN